MSFSASDEVTLSVNKDGTSLTAEGVVIKSDGDGLQIAMRGKGILVKSGSLLHLTSAHNSSISAWASVDQIQLAGDVKLVQLSLVRYDNEALPRAVRVPIEIGISASFSDREANMKRTVGHTVNFSTTGIRARFRAAVPIGTTVHVLVLLSEDKVLEAVAKVARIIEGAETASGGFEVGLEFVRFIRGYDHLADVAPLQTEAPDVRSVA
jgi:hypothetical protein